MTPIGINSEFFESEITCMSHMLDDFEYPTMSIRVKNTKKIKKKLKRVIKLTRKNGYIRTR